MKNLKAKVMASLAMLVIAAIMLTSASFAWYTVSQEGEVQKVKVDLKALENLEIAKATDDTTVPDEANLNDASSKGQYAWGSKVNEWADVTPLDYVATMSETALVTAEFSEDGRIGTPTNATRVATFSDGIGYYTAPGVGLGNTEGKVAVEYNVWLRTNTEDSDGAGLDVTAQMSTPTGGTTANFVVTMLINDLTGTEKSYTMNSSTPAYFKLKKDTATKVKILVYFDGDKITAKDVENGLTTGEFGITFTATHGLNN